MLTIKAKAYYKEFIRYIFETCDLFYQSVEFFESSINLSFEKAQHNLIGFEDKASI